MKKVMITNLILGLIMLPVLILNPTKAKAVTNPVTDTLAVTGTIDSSITFTLTGNTINFGALSTTVIKYATTGADGVSGTPSTTFPAAANVTAISVSTNATSGVLITIQGTYNGLRHSGHNEEVIASVASSTYGAVAEKYFAYGRINTGTGLTLNSLYSSTAGGVPNGTQALDNTIRELASSTGPITANTASVIFGAARDTTTVATTGAETYSDTVTIICTNRY